MLVENILEWKNSVHLEGPAEGEQIGIRKGELAVLRRLMERKFGPLPAETVEEIFAD